MSFLASWLPFGFVRASASARRAALQSSFIDEIDTPDGSATLIAGGRQTEGALPVSTPHFEAALYCSRGRGYARYNEDAAGLFCDRQGDIYAFVLDQAGGLGGQVRGQASQIAANHIFDACQRLAKSNDLDALTQLEIAYDRAHRVLVQREEGEVTTAVAAVIRSDTALLLNSGDSGAIHFDRRGLIRAKTRPQELDGLNIGCLEHALGLVPEGASPEAYTWEIEPGDWLLLSTDGLSDSGLEDMELGKILAGSSSPEDAVNKICTMVLRRMGTFRAKPDNLTVVAVRAKSVAPAT